MQCVYPLAAWQTHAGDIHFYPKGSSGKSITRIDSPDGKVWIGPKRPARTVGLANYRRDLILPCGQCIACKVNRGRDWSLRIMHETSSHEANCFITLTYSEENLPMQGQLVYGHFQDFMKRLRYHVRTPIRYYMCGEYGEKYDRPHFHAILFGHDFRDDRVLVTRTPNGAIYTSALLERVWSYGFCSIGDATIESAAYVAGYVTKKVTGKNAEEHYMRVDGMTGEIYQKVPEFSNSSRDPAIGVGWLDKYYPEVVNSGGVIVPGGMNMGVPRAYIKRLEARGDYQRDLLDITRLSRTRCIEPNNNTYERHRIREEIYKARIGRKKRDLE